MGEAGDLPGEGKVGGCGIERFGGSARSELGGFGGLSDGERGGWAEAFVEFAVDDGGGFGGVESAGEDKERVVGAIAGVMVVDHLLVGDGVEEVEVSDDGVASRIVLVGGAEEKLAGDGIGVVVVHGDFATDDLFFFFEFVFGEGRSEGHFEQSGEKEVE